MDTKKIFPKKAAISSAALAMPGVVAVLTDSLAAPGGAALRGVQAGVALGRGRPEHRRAKRSSG